MSDYGLKCWDDQQNITLDTTATISRVRFSHVASKTETDSIVLSDISGKNISYFTILVSPSSITATRYGHILKVSGTTVSWKPIPITGAGGAGTPMSNGSSLIVVMLNE